jgi:hypothetical protein
VRSRGFELDDTSGLVTMIDLGRFASMEAKTMSTFSGGAVFLEGEFRLNLRPGLSLA